MFVLLARDQWVKKSRELSSFVPLFLCSFVPLFLCSFVPLFLCSKEIVIYKMFSVNLSLKLFLYEYAQKNGTTVKDIVNKLVSEYLNLNPAAQEKLIKENTVNVDVSEQFSVFISEAQKLNMYLALNGLRSQVFMNALLTNWRKNVK